MYFIIDFSTGEPQVVTNEDGSCKYFKKLMDAVEYGREHLQVNQWKPYEQCM